MRNYTLLLLAVLSVSCAKAVREVEVTFGLGVSSGPLVRSDDGVYSALSATAPVGPFSLVARSEDNELRSYSVTTGVPLTMAVGGYEVTGSGSGETVCSVRSGRLCSSPSWTVDESVEVGTESSEYSVTASYSCFALVFDRSEVDRVETLDSSGAVVELEMPGDAGHWVLYARTDGAGVWTRNSPLYVYVYPEDEVYGEVRMYMVGNVQGGTSGSDYLNAEYGRWYRLSPGRVEVTSGSMGVNFPEWTEGSY